MISLPIWLLVLLCVFGFLGVVVFIAVVICLIGIALTPNYISEDYKEENYGTQENKQE